MRSIDFTQPLSDDDVEYVLQRPWLATEAGIDPATLEDNDFNDEEEGLNYSSLNKGQLVEEAERRGIDSSGTKADIIERLEAADAADEGDEG